MNKEMSEVEKKLLEAKSRQTITKIVNLLKEQDGKDYNREYVLEKIENYVVRFDLNVSDKEMNYLQRMREYMYDHSGLIPKELCNKREEVKQTAKTIQVDFKNKKRISP